MITNGENGSFRYESNKTVNIVSSFPGLTGESRLIWKSFFEFTYWRVSEMALYMSG